MTRSRFTGEWAAAHAERQARARLAAERAINRVIESRNPSLLSTDRYREGPLPPSHPRFGSPADYADYETVRERGRFDPEVKYPTAKKGDR